MKTIVTLVIACAGFGAMVASSTARTQQRDEKQAIVQITGQAISVRQCIKPLDENKQQEVSELMYR